MTGRFSSISTTPDGCLTALKKQGQKHGSTAVMRRYGQSRFIPGSSWGTWLFTQPGAGSKKNGGKQTGAMPPMLDIVVILVYIVHTQERKMK